MHPHYTVSGLIVSKATMPYPVGIAYADFYIPKRGILMVAAIPGIGIGAAEVWAPCKACHARQLSEAGGGPWA